MPIIPVVGRRSRSSRFIIGAIYFLLIIGSITMVYPFLLMLSTSISSSIDYQEYRVVPSYLFNRKVLYQKFLEDAYMNVNDLNKKYKTDYYNFREIKLPEINPGSEEVKRILNDWVEFKGKLPVDEYTNYSVFCQRGIKKLYAKFLKNKYKNIGNLNNAYKEDSVNFIFIDFPFEDLIVPGWKREMNRKVADYLEFKRIVPAQDRSVVTLEWEFVEFLKEKYVTIENLNKSYKSSYADFAGLYMPPEKPDDPAMAEDWVKFVSKSVPERYKSQENGRFRLINPENLYRDFLHGKYPDIGAVNKAYKTNYRSYGEILPPYKEEDLLYLDKNRNFLFMNFMFKNYITAVQGLFVRGRAMSNTFFFCFMAVLTSLTINPLCAYALSKFKLKYANRVLLFLLATMAFPAEVTMIPGFLLVKKLGMLNTFYALILPGMANGFSIFILKGFFDSLPKEIYEAAEIDGATTLRMFWNITLPLSTPVLAVIGLASFTEAYGAFMFAFLVCQKEQMWTIMVYLYQYQSEVTPPEVAAALVIASIPTLLIFIFCQKIIIKGIVVPTLK